jgi:hypothetical protein
MYRLLTTVSCIVAAASAAAHPVELSNEALKSTFAGSLLEFDTPAGTTISVRVGRDGLLSGEGGVLGPVLGAARDRGRWWTADNRLCVKWFRWFEAETRCVKVHQDGERLYWNGANGRSGTATIIERGTPIEARASTPSPAAPSKPEPATEVAAATEPAAENSSAVGEAKSIRFATASFGAMTFVPPVGEPGPAVDAHKQTAEPAAPAPDAAEEKQAAPKPMPAPRQAALAENRSDASFEAPATHASSTVILASFRVAGVDADDMLNVRSGPSESYAPVGGLPPQGRGVRIVGPCQQEWCPIRHGHMTGWVNRYFLAEETTGPPAAGFSR